jgi:hypothetical protein
VLPQHGHNHEPQMNEEGAIRRLVEQDFATRDGERRRIGMA